MFSTLCNKKFRQVAIDANLLKEVALKDIDEYVYEEVENVLAKARKLQKLTLKQNVLKANQLIKVAFETSKALKSLQSKAASKGKQLSVTSIYDLPHLPMSYVFDPNVKKLHSFTPI